MSFLTDVSSDMTYPLLPVFLATVLGASATAVGAIEGAAESTAALLKLASGWWSDRAARRKPLVVAGYTIASVIRPLIGLAQSVAQVLAHPGDRPLGKGIRTSPRDALIADSVDPAIRGRAFGFHRAADHAGAVVGPLLAFALCAGRGLDLRTVFLLTAIPGALAVLMLLFGVREVPRAGARERLRRRSTSGASRRAVLGLSRRPLAVHPGQLDRCLPAAAGGPARRRAGPGAHPLGHAPRRQVRLQHAGRILSDRLGRKPLIVAGWLALCRGLLRLRSGRAARGRPGRSSPSTAFTSASPREWRRRWWPTSCPTTGAAPPSAGTTWP